MISRALPPPQGDPAPRGMLITPTITAYHAAKAEHQRLASALHHLDLGDIIVKDL